LSPQNFQENRPNDPTTLCIVHSGVNGKLIKYFIYFRLHPWRVRGFENPLRPIHRSLWAIASSSYEVLKYEDSEREMTVCFNRNYGPIISRGNHYKGHETYDRPKQEERLLIEIIRNDSINFGGI
jgi:hypothetical protein